MTLRDWIDREGGRKAVAAKLRVTPEAIYYWLMGKATPNFKTIFEIVRLSEGKVTMKQILDETKTAERAAKKRGSK